MWFLYSNLSLNRSDDYFGSKGNTVWKLKIFCLIKNQSCPKAVALGGAWVPTLLERQLFIPSVFYKVNQIGFGVAANSCFIW